MFELIKSSVGKNGKNKYDDVLNVQIRLNKWILAGRLPQLSFLAMDGDCGPKTKTAIGAFQCRYVDLPKIDKRIDPKGKTEQMLNVSPFEPPPLRVSEQVYVDWLRNGSASAGVDDVPYWEKRGMFWFGVGVKAGGGTTPVNGQDTLLATMYNLESPSNKFIVTASTKRVISGGGGISAGGVVVFITGIYHPKDLNKIELGGFDWNLAIGGKWGSFAKWAAKAPQLAQLVQAAKLSKFANAGTVGTTASVMKSGAASHGLFVDDPNPSMVSLDIPIGGAGLEASFYYGITKFQISNLQLDE